MVIASILSRIVRWLAFGLLAGALLTGPAGAAESKRRVALIIYAAKYENWSQLDNTPRDAVLIKTRLENLKFEQVILSEDKGYDDLRDDLKAFEKVAEGADLVLIYYTGHGAQIGGKPFIIPKDAKASYNLFAGLADNYAIAVENLIALAKMGDAGLVLIDACRDNVGHDTSQDLGEPKGGPPRLEIDPAWLGDHTLVQTSTGAGQVAYDGVPGRNSAYALAVDHAFGNFADVAFEPMLNVIEDKTSEATGKRQQPALIKKPNVGAWWGNLAGTPPRNNEPLPMTDDERVKAADKASWDFAERLGEISGYEIYLKVPNGAHEAEARQKIETLRAAQRAHLTGTADEARRALARLSEQDWRTLTQQELLSRVSKMTTAGALRLLAEQEPATSPAGPRATVLRAAMYDYGEGGVEVSAPEALMLYQQAADAKNPTAQRIMAEFGQFGRDGVTQPLTKVKELYEAAHLGGDAIAQDRLGSMYAEGAFGDKLKNEAAKLFLASADQGYAWGQCHYAGALVRGALGVAANPRKAFEYADKSAQLDNYCGEMLLGHMYLEGYPADGSVVAVNRKRGADLYLAAARQGAPEAMTSMGFLYQTGNGVDRDLLEARRYYEAASTAGYAHAKYLLGVMYAKGEIDGRPNMKLAVDYFRAAAAKQFHPAEAALGWAYSQGHGDLSPSQTEAVRLFALAAKGEDPEGLYRLAYALYRGDGVEKSPSAARELMRKSAAKGYAPAKRWLNGYGG